MSAKETCLIIFDPKFELMGEILYEDNKCNRINLNQLGEMLLGPHISEWQTHGVEHWTIAPVGKDSTRAMHKENHQMKSERFMEGLAEWLSDHGFNHLVLPCGAMSAFSEIQKMSVPAQKKFELALMLRDLPIQNLANG